MGCARPISIFWKDTATCWKGDFYSYCGQYDFEMGWCDSRVVSASSGFLLQACALAALISPQCILGEGQARNNDIKTLFGADYDCRKQCHSDNISRVECVQCRALFKGSYRKRFESNFQ